MQISHRGRLIFNIPMTIPIPERERFGYELRGYNDLAFFPTLSVILVD